MFIRNDRLNFAARPAALTLGMAALLGLSGLVLAQPPQASFGPPAFGTIDLNGDGRVSADEFTQHRAQRRAARAAEGRPMRNAASAPTFESLDRDGNGYLTSAEVTQGQQARFASRGPGYGRGYGAGYGPGYGRGFGAGYGPGAGMGGRPCWRSW
jgi:hypothetical protein